jgi:hypothetical protein
MMSDIDQKVNELLSLVKALDTKIKFIMDDTDEIKQSMSVLNDTISQVAMASALQKDQKTADTHKSARLDAFRQETARW